MNDPLASAVAAAEAVRTRQVSPVELLDECLRRIDERDGPLNSVIWRDDEMAYEAARAAERLAASTATPSPPLLGVPIPIKDLTPVRGWPTTYGSRGVGTIASLHDAPVITALREAGCVLCGRTNTPEFGALPSTENLRYGITRNPWDPALTPGGSSGGAAAAVAAGLVPLAHGNDGGGSLRVPAACTGTVGVKPSRGRVPNRHRPWDGLVAEGFIGRTVLDVAVALDAVAKPDAASWATALPLEQTFREAVTGDRVERLRIGVLQRAPMGIPVDPSHSAALDDLAGALDDAGHQLIPTDLVMLTPPALTSFLALQAAGLAMYDGVEWAATEPHVRAARQRAEQTSSLTFTMMLRQVESFAHRLALHWGRDFDVLICPTTAGRPPEAGHIIRLMHERPVDASLPTLTLTAFTAAANLAGLPAVSLPTHTADGLPIGTMIVGGPWDDGRLLRLAAEVEQLRPWMDRSVAPTPVAAPSGDG